MTSQIRRRPTPEPTLQYGDEFGPYIITGFAGSGATSYVYRARRRDRFEPVAIKVLHPHLVADPTKRLTFYREARVMMRMQHPNVVRFEEIIEAGNTLAFVMEYIDGVTLTQWRQSQREGVDEMTLACVFVDILRGVTAAHREGVVHRDLKPANILITEESGRAMAKIIDFGVARFVDQPLTEQEKSKIVGTAAYISPEEVGDPDAVGLTSDLYSVGVMLYEAACGQRPFDNMEIRELLEAQLKRAPQRPRTLNPELSSGLEEVILRTLEKNPGERFASAPEMIGALELAIYQYQGLEEFERVLESSRDPEAALETVLWPREATLKSDGGPRRGFGRFFKRCLEMAFVLVTSSGVRSDQSDPHYLHRAADAQFPFR